MIGKTLGPPKGSSWSAQLSFCIHICFFLKTATCLGDHIFHDARSPGKFCDSQTSGDLDLKGKPSDQIPFFFVLQLGIRLKWGIVVPGRGSLDYESSVAPSACPHGRVSFFPFLGPTGENLGL